MAKTLNQFLEGYLKVKNPDEQKFVDKHVVAKHADRNGNDDEVFKGSKVKMADRRKDRHGYNPGEDEKVYEALKGSQHKIDANKNGKVDAHDFHLLRKKKKVAEEAEELEELSTPTLQSYRTKARAQGNKIVDKMKMGGGDWSKDQQDTKTLRKRSKGANMSGKQLVKRGESLKTEEADQIDEILDTPEKAANYKAKAQKSFSKNVWISGDKAAHQTAKKRLYGLSHPKVAEEVEIEEKLNIDKASMGTVVKDFQKSDAPQFKGKSQDKRRAMAIAAKLTAERGGKPLRKEEKLADLLGDLTETHRRTMLSVFDKLNEDNQKKFLEACETPEGVESMLDFSISHRGE